MDDNFVRRKKYERDKLFLDLNSYHENIKLKLEILLIIMHVFFQKHRRHFDTKTRPKYRKTRHHWKLFL